MRRGIVRMTALALCAVLVVAACGGGDDEGAGGPGGTDGEGSADLPPCPVGALDDADGPVEITVWHSQTAKPEEALQELAATYNDSQDRVRVTLQSQGASYQELNRKYLAAIPSGDLPDVVLVDDTSTQLLADSQTVLPAQSCFDAVGDDLSAYDPTAVAYYSIDGALYPGSAGLANVLLFYNKNHFRAAGLDPEDPPGTLAEMTDAAEAIAAAGITETPIAHELSSWKTEFWLTGDGAPVVDDDNGRGGSGATASAFDNASSQALYRWLSEIDAEGLLLPVARTDGGIEQYLALASQSASMVVESTSAATSVEAFLQGEYDAEDLGAEPADEDMDLSVLDIGAGEFPGIEEPGQIQVGGWAWYMTTAGDDAHQSAAWDFLTFLNTDESQVTMTLVASNLPWRLGVVDDPRIQEAWSSSLAGQWLALAYQQQLDGLDPAFPGPLIGPYDQVRAGIEASMEELVLEGADVDEALATATAEIDAALEQYAAEGF